MGKTRWGNGLLSLSSFYEIMGIFMKILAAFLIVSFFMLSPAYAFQPGDINDDGNVNLTDAVMSLQLLSGASSGDFTVNADVNNDGRIGAQETIFALLWTAGLVEQALTIPSNQFNIGDSIGEGMLADGSSIIRHDMVWSTGYTTNDDVNSLNERFEAANPAGYDENSAANDLLYNVAEIGAEMEDFAAQAAEVVANARAMGGAGMITVFLGNNDACASSLDKMTDAITFETEYRVGLEILANSDATRNAVILVSGIPAIYWLWVAKKDAFWCRNVWISPYFEVCDVLLDGDYDCESPASLNDPDNIYAGDGTNCRRRKEFHRVIRDDYNPILKNVLQEYIDSGKLPHAFYTDIFDIKLQSRHINDTDCFHPSEAGHAMLAEEHWKRSRWGDK
jgi:lysophospholipase L1-like esterase